MRKWKAFIKKLFFLPLVWTIVLTLLSGFALYYAFAKSPSPVIQYLAYALSAYTLTLLCCRIPAIAKKVKTFRHANPYLAKYYDDKRKRIKLILQSNVVFNGFVALFHLLTGIGYQSAWSYALAAYYSLLCAIRLFLLRDVENVYDDTVMQWKRFHLCGFLLLPLQVALSCIVFFIVRQNKGFSYSFIYTIGLAAFTFAVVVIAIIGAVRYRRHAQPIFRAVKYVNVSAALVSLLALETAMLHAFGNGDERFSTLMTAITDAVVCTVVLSIAVYMVLHGGRNVKEKSTKKG